MEEKAEETPETEEAEEEEPEVTEEAEKEKEPSEDEELPTEEAETPKEEVSEEAAEEKAAEEEAPSRREEKEKEFVEERIYTIPLRRAWAMPSNKRAPKAIHIIKAFVKKHMKVSEEAVEEEEEEEKEGGRIIVSNEVNERIWSKGIKKPPRKLRIRAAKDEEGNVTIFLA